MPERIAAVIGAGTMGCGIAEVMARAGFCTLLFDQTAELAEQGTVRVKTSVERAVERGKLDRDQAAALLGRIRPVSALDAVTGAEWIVEAVPEVLELKKKLFGTLSELAPDALLASNTSSLPVTELAAAAARPERVVGLHFFNPAPVMELLEVVRAEQTSQDVIDHALELAETLGKSPILVQDVAGFATSRLGIALGLEAIRMVEMGVASPADIDKAMELGYRHPMGPLKLTDLVGLDVRLAIADHLCHEIGPQFAAPPLLRRLVRAGHLGKKTGCGFYLWEDGKTPRSRSLSAPGGRSASS